MRSGYNANADVFEKVIRELTRGQRLEEHVAYALAFLFGGGSFAILVLAIVLGREWFAIPLITLMMVGYRGTMAWARRARIQYGLTLLSVLETRNPDLAWQLADTRRQIVRGTNIAPPSSYSVHAHEPRNPAAENIVDLFGGGWEARHNEELWGAGSDGSFLL